MINGFRRFGAAAAACAGLFAAACTPTLKNADIAHDASLFAYFNAPLAPPPRAIAPGTLVADGNIAWEVPAPMRGCFRRKLAAAGAEAAFIAAADACAPKLDQNLVVMGIAGGGNKAEVFALEVMEELDHYGLLHEIDAIASASGGSFAALVYALSCDPPESPAHPIGPATCDGDDAWRWRWAPETIHAIGEIDYFWPFLFTRFRPDQIVLNLATYHDTGDSFVEVLRNSLFGHRPYATFADLNPERPALILTATNLTRNREALLGLEDVRIGHELRRRSAAQHFSFTPRYFAAIGSDLGSYELVRALGASAAFPVFIDPTTLRDYLHAPADATACAQLNWFEPSDCEGFVHLTDAGVHDNSGLSELQWFVECTFRDRLTTRPRVGSIAPYCDPRIDRPVKPKTLLSMVIDVSSQASRGRDNERADERFASGSLPFTLNTVAEVFDMMSLANTTQRKADLATLTAEVNHAGVAGAFVDFGAEALNDPPCFVDGKCAGWDRVLAFALAHDRKLRRTAPTISGTLAELFRRVSDMDMSVKLSDLDRVLLRDAAPWIVARRIIQLCDSGMIVTMFPPERAAAICRGA